MIGYNKSRLVYYCPIKRARTSFGSRGPQELFPLPFHTHNLNHVSAFFYLPWKVAINRAARAVFAEWDDFGFLFGVCDDAVWAVLNTPPEGCCGTDQSSLPQLPWVPVLILLPVTFFKRATDSRAAWLACSASFCEAILDSIGDANRLAIADPETDTLHLSSETSS